MSTESPQQMDAANLAPEKAPRPRIVIVGAGFGGLATALKLGGRDVDVILIDKRNHHLFQPLLYQVATAALSPADIAEPVRKIVRRYSNITVLMGEVLKADCSEQWIELTEGVRISYEYLVVATGSEYAYFGNEQWATFAPGLKTIANARELRGQLLRCFEKAELWQNFEQRSALLTCIVVGGGPTGVEMSGAVAELSRWTLKNEFRRVDPAQMRVLLVEGGDRILSQFPLALSKYAREQLEGLGVTVMTGSRVSRIDQDGAVIDGEFVPAGTCVWAAGVRAAPAASWLGVSPDRMGRIEVDPHLRVVGLQNVFALGDLAKLEQDGQPLPALAQVARQQGEYLGQSLADAIAGRTAAPFRFRNRGNTAVIGRHAAIFDFGSWQLKGRLAWFLWAIVHVYLLVSFEKRALVSLQWVWRYFTRARGARLIP